jgi:hypothetical protein
MNSPPSNPIDEFQAPPGLWVNARTRARLMTFIKRNGGRITPRQVVREGPYYRNCTVASTALEAFVRAGFGRWEYSRSGHKGGRPRKVFVLTHRRRISAERDDTHALELALNYGLGSCDHARTLAADFTDAIRCNRLDDPGLTIAEIHYVLTRLAMSLSTLLPVGHRHDKTPVRRTPQRDIES